MAYRCIGVKDFSVRPCWDMTTTINRTDRERDELAAVELNVQNEQSGRGR